MRDDGQKEEALRREARQRQEAWAWALGNAGGLLSKLCLRKPGEQQKQRRQKKNAGSRRAWLGRSKPHELQFRET